MKYLFSALIIILIFVSCSKKQTVNKNIQEVVEKYVAANLLNGSIIVAHKNNIIYQGSFGYANIETKDTITSSTLFPLASVTKQFTTTAIMILQEKGKLSINDNINDYIKVPKSMKDITIKNLMNHTSGIPDYVQNDIGNNKDSILDFHFKHDTLLFSPNTNHSYCNSGYFLLGQIIENVSKKTYSDFMNENIFEPTGMNHTFVYDGTKYNNAIGYDENWNINDYLMTTADCGIISTVKDLLLWNIALSENKILSSESRNMMFVPVKLEDVNRRVEHGLGWDIHGNSKSLMSLISHNALNKNKKREAKIVSHTGNLASFGAYNQYDTENEYFIILLSNRILPELMDLINDINEELYK